MDSGNILRPLVDIDERLLKDELGFNYIGVRFCSWYQQAAALGVRVLHGIVNQRWDLKFWLPGASESQRSCIMLASLFNQLSSLRQLKEELLL